jgi:hypothetical protein
MALLQVLVHAYNPKPSRTPSSRRQKEHRHRLRIGATLRGTEYIITFPPNAPISPRPITNFHVYQRIKQPNIQ